MKNILAKIRQTRLDKGYSQESMAVEMNMSQPAYSKLESGQSKMSLENFIIISRILKTNFLDFEETASHVSDLEKRLSAVEKLMQRAALLP